MPVDVQPDADWRRSAAPEAKVAAVALVCDFLLRRVCRRGFRGLASRYYESPEVVGNRFDWAVDRLASRADDPRRYPT